MVSSTINVSTADRVRAWKQLSIDLAQHSPRTADLALKETELRAACARDGPAVRRAAIRHITARRAGRRAGQTLNREGRIPLPAPFYDAAAPVNV
jgi:hypothetical protein